MNALAAIPLLASLVLSYRAGPGTVYVAADSRLTPTAANSSRPPTDTICKIRVLNDGIVFVGTGSALFSADRVRTNIYTVAAKAAAELQNRPLTAEDVRSIAFAWRAKVHSRMIAMLRATPGLRTEAALSTTGATGSFYAAIASGEVYGMTVRVAATPDRGLEDIEEPQEASGYLVATGTNEAKSRALAVAPGYAWLPWPGRLEAIEAETIRIETMRYGRGSEIGGAIDLIEITVDGPVWLRRKPACH